MGEKLGLGSISQMLVSHCCSIPRRLEVEEGTHELGKHSTVVHTFEESGKILLHISAFSWVSHGRRKPDEWCKGDAPAIAMGRRHGHPGDDPVNGGDVRACARTLDSPSFTFSIPLL